LRKANFNVKFILVLGEGWMDTHKLSNILVGFGLVLLIGALIWWYSFYSEAARQLGNPNASMSEIVVCLFYNNVTCTMITGMAALAGVTSFSPTITWVGLIILVVGVVIRAASSKPAYITADDN
jgi:hypothetical protein